MGGETRLRPCRSRTGRGLSPRGRGNRPRAARARRRAGSIPAWAGKPHHRHSCSEDRRVYPRVGGETTSPIDSTADTSGLSPRGRGNRPGPHLGQPARGSIPAWAGKPRPRRRQHQAALGLSPRGRGNRSSRPGCCRPSRSIPAWAGKPASLGGDRAAVQVYPRVGGETVTIRTGAGTGSGLSPRGRGNHSPRADDPSRRRSIPAWAGKPGRTCGPARVVKVYPRVGGETRARHSGGHLLPGLSPRGRGNPLVAGTTYSVLWSIPAWAGKPLRHSDSFVCICQRSLVLLGATAVHPPYAVSDSIQVLHLEALDDEPGEGRWTQSRTPSRERREIRATARSGSSRTPSSS